MMFHVNIQGNNDDV